MPAIRSPRGLHPSSSSASSEQSGLDPGLARLGGFSDAVFAIGATLLIVTIRIPNPTDADAGRGLLALLTDQWRSYLGYAVSFMLIGISWTNQRVMFAAVSITR